MGEQLFLIWNGWGVLFTVLIALWMFLHIYFIEKFGSGTIAKNYIVLIPIVVIPLTFIFSGWVLGVFVLPIGMLVGVYTAKMIIRKK